MKRYDGNPSGHISMDDRVSSFAKEIIKREYDFLDKMRNEGLDKPGTWKRPENDIIEWEAPLTDREVKMFSDANPLKHKTIGHNTSSSLKKNRNSFLNEMKQHEQLLLKKQQNLMQKKKKEEYQDLVREKKKIEDELKELDEIVSYKQKKEAAQYKPRAERPFSNFLETHRAPSSSSIVTPPLIGSWDR